MSRDDAAHGATMVDTSGVALTGSQPPPDVIAGRYEIQALLGAGGMGQVYRAIDRTLDEVVAIKVLRRSLVGDSTALDRFRQEVKLARKVTSPHVVRTFDLGTHGDDHFLTMELVAGRSLFQVLADGAPPLAEALRISRAVSAGIAAAHAVGVLHRDLKPDNVLVGTDGRVAITDFGIAQMAASPIATSERWIGTPAYMAPEQVQGATTIGPQADIYAFGAILFELVTGRRAFPGTQAIAVAVARLQQPPPDPRTYCDLPDELAQLVLRCLAIEPSDRYLDGAALGLALSSFDVGAATPAKPSLRPVVPAAGSMAVALIPFRASAGLADVAEGLGEEIVDALSMTPQLLVKPVGAVRRVEGVDDSRELGRQLGVDVVIEGSLRKTVGETIRISARAIGIADGFQLWANRIDTTEASLLAASDELARAVARALTVEIKLPSRAPIDPRAVAHYLEGKARLRLDWVTGNLTPAITHLEAAYRLAPDDPPIIAALALATARIGWFEVATERLRAAGVLANRALSLAPELAECSLAVAVVSFLSGDVPAAAIALFRAVSRSPNLVFAQALIGAIASEVGALDDGIAHLESAMALDPIGSQRTDLARAYIYRNRPDDAFRLLEQTRSSELFTELTYARFRMWAGETYTVQQVPTSIPQHFRRFAKLVARIHQTRQVDRAELAAVMSATADAPPRLRATWGQLIAEQLVFVGDLDGALEQIEIAAANGLFDRAWIERCPMLAPLRDLPRFIAAAAPVLARAAAIATAVRSLH